MMSFLFWTAIGFILGVIFASFFEWVLHRYFMHQPVWKFRYPFERHALIHHHIFKADHTYHLTNENDKKTIPLADVCLGTLILQSKVQFKQATGPSVPDVQPKQPARISVPAMS